MLASSTIITFFCHPFCSRVSIRYFLRFDVLQPTPVTHHVSPVFWNRISLARHPPWHFIVPWSNSIWKYPRVLRNFIEPSVGFAFFANTQPPTIDSTSDNHVPHHNYFPTLQRMNFHERCIHNASSTHSYFLGLDASVCSVLIIKKQVDRHTTRRSVISQKCPSSLLACWKLACMLSFLEERTIFWSVDCSRRPMMWFAKEMGSVGWTGHTHCGAGWSQVVYLSFRVLWKTSSLLGN